ncbi:hypothetical protein OCU04_009961 [Sclerotinia nivalis]|uniref:Uncharacterized protein n=1 Tax=Sclerotinia nivalis TaxID=352851 RepID=A0A9X0ADQ8_9HELO|nr:hypothetical protein OCU04_009961 [Sclerotinia nivalis]
MPNRELVLSCSCNENFRQPKPNKTTLLKSASFKSPSFSRPLFIICIFLALHREKSHLVEFDTRQRHGFRGCWQTKDQAHELQYEEKRTMKRIDKAFAFGRWMQDILNVDGPSATLANILLLENVN